MSITWLKLHHDLLGDIKTRKFTAQEKWAWVALLILSSSSSERGYVTADDEDIADACDFNSTQDWLYFRDKLRSKGMIEPTEKGLKILNWEKRQRVKPSDEPERTKQRQQEKRERDRAAKLQALEESVTPCHAPVTPLSRDNHATDQISDLRSRSEEEIKKLEWEKTADADRQSPVFALSEPNPEGCDRPPPNTASETPLPVQPSNTQRDKRAAAPKNPKKEKLVAKDCYERLADLASFEQFYRWYCQRCKGVAPDANGKTPNPGDKASAAKAWFETVEQQGLLDAFRRGCQLFDWQQPGIPHSCRFIAGSEKHPTPYWLAAIERVSACEQPDDFLAKPSHPLTYEALPIEPIPARRTP